MITSEMPVVQHTARVIPSPFQTIEGTDLGCALLDLSHPGQGLFQVRNAETRVFSPVVYSAVVFTGVASPELTNASTWRPPREVRLHSLYTGGRRFELAAELPLSIAFDEILGWGCDYAALGIFVNGLTPELTVNAFASDFALLWDEIAQMDDAALSEDAIVVKSALRALVITVDDER